MSIMHVALFENCGDEGILAKTDASAIFIAVDLDAEELPLWTEVCGQRFHRQRRLDLDCCVGVKLHMRIHHGDVIDVHKDENAIAEDTEDRISCGQSVSEEEEELIDITMPTP